MLYTTSKPEDSVHNCCFAINDKNIISFRNGRHAHLKRDDTLQLYNLSNPELNFKVKVVNECTLYDVVVFEVIDSDIPYFPTSRDFLNPGTEYFQIGIDDRRKPFWCKGIITGMEDVFLVGQSNGAAGDAGSPLFGPNGQLFGMSICKQIPTDNSRYMISSCMLFGAGDVLLGKKRRVVECEECLRRKRLSEWDE
ncbi:unnamed protein product [Caenorhabditis angaria]|uniref:Peptidase S1 domain-containing protein n=1 Tax=Caenorhabditis angaria TaxID=860376 RepID=A0A9P1N0T6_9PELO|nr:unnamed protein product [Caenorhabditis angaria]